MPSLHSIPNDATAGWTTIEQLCDIHLGARPSAAALAQLKKTENAPAQVRDFVDRIFRIMALSGFEARNLAPSLAWNIGVLSVGTISGGVVPSLSWEGRHKRIDAYLDANPWLCPGPDTRFLEMGCGFPPITAIDIANAHPDWQITGADPCQDEYLLYDDRGNYACLNGAGRVRYFQPGAGNAAELFALNEQRTATLQRFSQLFRILHPTLPETGDGELAGTQRECGRLIRHPQRLYEVPNLKLVRAGIGAELPCADIIRCFNVLMYFDRAFRSKAEEWALGTLNPGGLLLCGGDSTKTTDARYTVYRNEDGILAAKEFAFSIEGLRPLIMLPWFSLHDGDREVMAAAALAAILRADSDFRARYDARNDALLAEKRLFVRDSEGQLTPAPDQLPQSLWIEAREQIALQLEREGFAEQAVAVLKKAGLNAWVNSAGHVAVDPAGLASAAG
jgi:hypothetical protein